MDVNNRPAGYSTAREDMLRFIPQGITRVLDVGCGEGHFGTLLKARFSAEVWGIEIHADAAHRAEDKLDRVFVGNIENGGIPLPENYFDCIVFNDVLEHLVDPWNVLKMVRKNLRKDGCIVASIPNIRYYKNMKDLVFRKKWEYVDAGIMDRTHLRFFTALTISHMFQTCGYRISTLSGIKYKKFPLWLALINILCFKSLEDMRYMQFGCVARNAAE